MRMIVSQFIDHHQAEREPKLSVVLKGQHVNMALKGIHYLLHVPYLGM